MNPLGEIVLKVSVILSLALAISAALRAQSAALRHWVLSVGVVCAVTTPVFVSIAPTWRAPLGVLVAKRAEQVPLVVPVNDIAQSENSATMLASSNTATTTARGVTTAQLLASIWIAGAAVTCAAFLVGLARLSWIRSRARRVRDGAWPTLAREIAGALGIRRRVTLLQSDHPSLLFTWGHFRPIVILPRDASAWSDDRAHIVLCHELAHIRRGDWLVLILAGLLRSAYWFNPLTWLIGKRLRDESERACDDEVMNQGVEGSEYASELLALARILNAERPGWVAAPGMARRSSLERRVTAMVNREVNRQPVGRIPRVLILATIVALAVAVGGFTAAAQTFASYGGSVVDPTGSVVPGVTLSMLNTQSGQKYEITSSDVGSFEFVGLTAGEYELQTFVAGFRTRKSAVTIGSKNVRNDIRLEVGSLEETITVVDRGEPRADNLHASVGKGIRPEKPACVVKPTGGFLAQPRKIADSRPVYPRSGGVPKADGVVVLDAFIGTDGTVTDAHAVDPAVDPDLAGAAIEAVKLWRYTPTLLNCVPIDVQMKVTVNFRTE
jgi:TonB family protein